MANFNFTVDTKPMANEISTVSRHVDVVSGSVVAMQTAVIKAEKEGAELVCQNVNKGFYTLMQSQITQKMASLVSTIEAKLIEMGQQVITLQNIKKRMERDYNMISLRYSKLFNSLNANLQTRVYELDRPVVKLINKDMQVTNSRIKAFLNSVPINQGESILNSQLILTSKTKKDSAEAINAIHQFVKSVNRQTKQAESVIENINSTGVEKIYLPIIITESSNELGVSSINYFSAQDDFGGICDSVDNQIYTNAIETTRNGEWVDISDDYRVNLDSEFSKIVIDNKLDERVKNMVTSLYSATKGVKQLKGS